VELIDVQLDSRCTQCCPEILRNGILSQVAESAADPKRT
jgi:hypothetical protein